MDETFKSEINKLIQKQGLRSLRKFYNEQNFPFSYEYLRQIVLGGRMPTDKVIDMLAHALGVESDKLKRLAVESRVSLKVRKLYKLPPNSSLGKLSEKIETYKKSKKLHVKLLQLFDQLDPKEQKQVIEYIKFLNKQLWRQEQK